MFFFSFKTGYKMLIVAIKRWFKNYITRYHLDHLPKSETLDLG